MVTINCHCLRLYSAAGRGIAAVSSATEESDLYLYLYLYTLRWMRLEAECCVGDAVKASSATDVVPPISRPSGKLPTEDATVLTIRQILKYTY